MIKKLFFTAALLVPCLANGADPSANLSVKVVPPGSAPSGPSAPPGAVAAGFTTVALNSDWTQPMPKNWLGGCPNGPDRSQPNNPNADDKGHTWWLNIWWSYSYQSCILSQIQDPDYGGLVLDMPWTVDTKAAQVGTHIQTASPNYNGAGAGTANTFPPGMYLEIEARNAPVNVPGNYFAFYTWGAGGIYDYALASTEWDVVEADGDRLWLYDSAVHNWSTGGQGNWILQPWTNLAAGTNFDASKYNTYALRITNDGNTEVGCLYVNRVFQACQFLPQGMNDAEKNDPHTRLFLLVANACDYWNQTTSCADGTLTHLYVKSVRVWSCKDWETTLCTGSLLAQAP